MTAKEKYIGAYLDGYFSAKEFKEYGLEYLSALNIATENAEKKYKKYKKQLKKEKGL